MILSMEPIVTYRGKAVYEEDLTFIKKLIAEHPQSSRRKLSVQLCEAWNWVQPNGQPRDMVCRSLMLELHRNGHIQLPEKRCSPPNPLGATRSRPPLVAVDQQPIIATVKKLGLLEIRQVRGTSSEKLYNSLIEHHHYLGYSHPVGEQLKYVIFAADRPIACFAFSSAPRHIGCRDRYIGWNQERRKTHLQYLAYNTRFLILPWVQVPHLASHLLGKIARRISGDWQEFYHHPLYLLETFVDTERFAGTCYKAANWQYAGLTTGVGKNSRTNIPDRSLKAVWVYPLHPEFRLRMCRG
jgi:hypothetical protein